MFERDGKMLTLTELHAAIKRENEEDLVRVEREGLARGMEPFDFVALLALTNHARAITVRGEEYLKFKYYTGDPPFENLPGFAEYVLELARWDD
jgi:hypothetical protein